MGRSKHGCYNEDLRYTSGEGLLSPKQTTSDRAHAAGCWFLQSGIQEPEGGVARYYRGDVGQNARVSTEITGYAISSLVYLHGRTGDDRCLAGARKAGDFLIEHAWDNQAGVFPFEHSFNGSLPDALAYFFDSGIIARGFLALWRATDDERYLNAAVKAGEAMGRHFRAKDAIHPILQLPSMEPLAYTPQWSRGPGCYQLKSAMAWFDLFSATGTSRFLEWYEEALQSALRSHVTFLPAETPEKTMDRLHAYSYFLEGAMPAAERAEVQSALRDGISRVAVYLREIASTFERSDVYAQLLRVRLFAEQLAGIPVEHADAEREARRIPEFQLAHHDVRYDGGYAFGRKGGAIIPHMNPVSTAFCSQALTMWSDYGAGKVLELQSLI